MVFLMIGILITQLLYVFSNWRQYRKDDYIRYGLYISLFILYIVCLFAPVVFRDPEILSRVLPVTEMIKRPVAVLIYLVYFRFMDLFLELRERFPLFHRQVLIVYKWIVAFFVIQITMLVLGITYTKWGNLIYFGLSFILFGMSVVFIIRAYQHKSRLTITLLRGCLCLSVGAFITNVFNIVSPLYGRSVQLVPDNLFLFTGILLELFFFNMALAYKMSQEDTELADTQQKVILQLRQNEQLAVEQQQTRNKIARDLHDEVGATLSGVTLFSELSQLKVERREFADVEDYLQRITNECTQMGEKINDIVWTTQLHNDSLEKLLDRLHEYARPICVSQGVELRFRQEYIREMTSIPDHVRNHLYLFCKEGINNSLKYAQASVIEFAAEYTGNLFRVCISDDGRGFDTAQRMEGNGLQNMRVRAHYMEGNFTLHSEPGKGTTILLTLNRLF